MERELRERDNAYRADALQKQQAIENLKDALSVALTKLDARPPLTASGGAPPPPPGGGNAPVGEEFLPQGKAEEGQRCCSLLLPHREHPNDHEDPHGPAPATWRWGGPRWRL
jgi:hypothetical protein